MPTHSLPSPSVVSAADWLTAQRELLRAEKELTRHADQLAARRRAMPWVRIDQDYTFESVEGAVTLAELFAGRRQLVIQHFMFGREWDQGCKSCSFMLDHFNAAAVHLPARDVSFAVVSHAPLAQSLPFKARMGWDVAWVSSHGSAFNRDFCVSFTAEEMAKGEVDYNFTRQPFPVEEAPGVSFFVRDEAGAIYRTHSAYGRGVEFIMGTYHILDRCALGRDEEGLEYGMEWLRHHDRYEPVVAEC